MAEAEAALSTRFRLDFVIERIRLGTFKRVALQFPDELLPWAPQVASELSVQLAEQPENDSTLVFVLGDTTYGACCVDEVAAEHLAANVVVHFGPACLSLTRKLPVIYVLLDIELKRDHCFLSAVQFVAMVRERQVGRAVQKDVPLVAVLYDIELHDSIHASTLTTVPEIALATPVVNVAEAVQPESALMEVLQPNPMYQTSGPLMFRKDAVFYVWIRKGQEMTMPLRNFLLSAASNYKAGNILEQAGILSVGEAQPIIWMARNSPEALEQPSRDIYRLLGKRYSLGDKIRQSERIGILVGTLAVAGLTRIADQCRKLVQEAGKRAYTILVGKPNPAKLGNFPDIDIFVLIACPENSLLSDSKDYYQPVITPLELDVALGSEDWSDTVYGFDFDSVARAPTAEESVPNRSIRVRASMELSQNVIGGAASFLKGKSWQGLNPNQSADSETPSKASEGRSGIAAGYENESIN